MIWNKKLKNEKKRMIWNKNEKKRMIWNKKREKTHDMECVSLHTPNGMEHNTLRLLYKL